MSATQINAASINDYPEIQKYVGSENRPESVGGWQFDSTPDTYIALAGNATKIVRYDIKSGKEIETIMSTDHTRETTIDYIEGFTISPEGSKILVHLNSNSIYRRSNDAEHYVYDLRTRVLKPLSTDHPRQQSPVFSPDGRMIAFVADNNIYLKKLDYWTEVAVTTDGKKNAIINGIPDWTYEEEFSTTCSMAWSPDNLTLCFLKYNETDVPTFTFQLYEGTCDKLPQYALYPGEFSYKYPVAGQKNSVVTLHSYDVETRKTKQIQLHDQSIEYIPRIAFGPAADQLMVTTLNRDQNRMELYSVNPRATTSRSILVEKWDAWLDPATYEDIRFLKDFFVVSSCRSGYQHIYAYSYNGSLLRQITSGDYDVTAYYGYSPTSNCHFYQTTQSGAINRVVCKIDSKGKITALSPSEGTSGASSWSPDMKYYISSFSDVNTPPVYKLMASASGKSIRDLVENTKYRAKWQSAPKAEFFTMQSDGYTLNGLIIKPADFDPTKRYPVIMSQYSGPGSQVVLNRWSMAAENYFAKAGYVVVSVDGRGTGGRGRAFMDVVYRQLGHYETIDQIAAANYAASLPYTDSSRIAIYGWSYGGYETIMAASHPNAPYAAAVAVAPVTDWRYYDTVYAERYMLTPQQNAEGYDKSSTLPRVADRRAPLLIMTGTADDNVHMFNTVQYAGATENIGSWCDILLFPNMNHSINGCSDSRATVYARLLDYLQTHMK